MNTVSNINAITAKENFALPQVVMTIHNKAFRLPHVAMTIDSKAFHLPQVVMTYDHQQEISIYLNLYSNKNLNNLFIN